eukprot:TRINITY_DN3025_c0_g1_i1.p1 TRINITY_DN3025_c0_g1~~TRINITY_DN3025_c0_g1_i1.p1  ORF type:complete len:587 (-),score=137.59 TRINITY_DN3025_c0_g1_i1:116-1876(-)
MDPSTALGSDPLVVRQVEKFARLSGENLGGQCVSRDIFRTEGNALGVTVPGMCMDDSGKCHCFDGKPAGSMGTIKSAFQAYSHLSKLMSAAATAQDLFCYDAPNFACLLPPKLSTVTNVTGDLPQGTVRECEDLYGKPTKPILSSLDVLGESSTDADEAAPAKVTIKGRKIQVNKLFAKKGRSKDGWYAKVAPRVIKKYVAAPLQLVFMKILESGGKVSLMDELTLLWESKPFRSWVKIQVGKLARKHNKRSIEVLMGMWSKMQLTPAKFYHWLTGPDVRKDWRKPWVGGYSKVLKKVSSLVGPPKSVMNKMCMGMSALGHPTVNPRTPYEDRPLSMLAFDSTEFLKAFNQPKQTEDQKMLRLYVVTAKPKFWRRAASIKKPEVSSDGLSMTYPKESQFSCYSPTYENKPRDFWLTAPARTGGERKVQWGCPDAIPKLNPENGNLAWAASGTGEDMVKDYKDEGAAYALGETICTEGLAEAHPKSCQTVGLRCVQKVTLSLKTCDTCCCKAGLISTSVDSQLLYGDRSECSGELASMDTALRGYMNALRLNELNSGVTQMCMNKDCLLYTSPSPRDRTRSRMPSSA